MHKKEKRKNNSMKCTAKLKTSYKTLFTCREQTQKWFLSHTILKNYGGHQHYLEDKYSVTGRDSKRWFIMQHLATCHFPSHPNCLDQNIPSMAAKPVSVSWLLIPSSFCRRAGQSPLDSSSHLGSSVGNPTHARMVNKREAYRFH